LPLDYQHKLQWADHHLGPLHDEVAGFLQEKSYDVIPDMDADSGRHVLRVKWKTAPLTSWGLMAGDVLFNLKSALDHIVFALSIYNPPISPLTPQFPIFTERTGDNGFDKNGKSRLKHVHPGAFTAIERMQPYQSPDPNGHPLALLNELHNRDKHRLLPVVVLTVNRIYGSYWGSLTESWRPKGFLGGTWATKPVKDGAEFYRFPPGHTPGPDPNRGYDLVGEVRFDQPFDLNILSTLDMIRDHIWDQVVPALEPFLA
jgi:hypothetical protein